VASHPDAWSDTPYVQLRHLTLPVVAVTTSSRGRSNGLIVNSAQRASLVPAVPRISLYISKTNLSHELVWASGVLAVHLLRQDQWSLIWTLGLESGRDRDKLSGFETSVGETGCPYLTDCIAAFECRVSNAMDAGAATFFLADVVAVHAGREGPVMTSAHFRDHMPEERKRQYEERLHLAQRRLASMAGSVSRTPWPGPSAAP
jgi:flavin reductase (DIM6/NTAB) family NADH-FMN oxidoreductase RutF